MRVPVFFIMGSSGDVFFFNSYKKPSKIAIFCHSEKRMGIKKEYRCTPTFVNLKSNTMKKITLQM